MSTPAPDPAGNPARGTIRGIWRRMVRAPLLVLARMLVGLHVEGMDRIPRHGAVLVVANHLHNADPVLISIAFPRQLHFMAKEELFRIPVVGRAITRFGNFPVARGKSDRRAIRLAVTNLHYGNAVGMFPEGTRSKVMHLSRPHAGAGLIALQGKSPILPLAITGSERLPFNGNRPEHLMPEPGHRGVRIRIGEPFMLPETTADDKRLTASDATGIMMQHIAALLPEDYRGEYACDGTTRATGCTPRR